MTLYWYCVCRAGAGSCINNYSVLKRMCAFKRNTTVRKISQTPPKSPNLSSGYNSWTLKRLLMISPEMHVSNQHAANRCRCCIMCNVLGPLPAWLKWGVWKKGPSYFVLVCQNQTAQWPSGLTRDRLCLSWCAVCNIFTNEHQLNQIHHLTTLLSTCREIVLWAALVLAIVA